MIGNSGRKTADIGIVGQVNQLVQRNGSDAVILLDFQKSIHPFDSRLLECVAELRKGCWHFHYRGRLIRFRSTVADLHLENCLI